MDGDDSVSAHGVISLRILASLAAFLTLGDFSVFMASRMLVHRRRLGSKTAPLRPSSERVFKTKERAGVYAFEWGKSGLTLKGSARTKDRESH